MDIYQHLCTVKLFITATARLLVCIEYTHNVRSLYQRLALWPYTEYHLGYVQPHKSQTSLELFKLGKFRVKVTKLRKVQFHNQINVPVGYGKNKKPGFYFLHKLYIYFHIVISQMDVNTYLKGKVNSNKITAICNIHHDQPNTCLFVLLYMIRQVMTGFIVL